MADGEGRNETDLERLDRNLNELLQELRVTQTGVQVLFAFLLALPFAQRFEQVTALQKGVYLATLLFSAAATAFLIAPVAHHRLVFRLNDKARVVFLANLFAIAGIAFLALAMTSAIFLAVDVLYRAPLVAIVTAGIGSLFALLWFVLPVARRVSVLASGAGASPRTPGPPPGSPPSRSTRGAAR